MMMKKIGMVFICVLLVGCGFHLRGVYALPSHLKTMHIEPNDPYNGFQRILRRDLKTSGVTLEDSAKGVYTLRILKHELSRSVMIIGTDGQTKQEELIYTVKYQLIPPTGEPLPEQTIEAHRILNVDYNRTLGQEEEEQTLVREMQQDASSQLLRRLAN